MYRVTTPTHIYTLPENANSYAEIQVTYRQKINGHKVKIVKHYQDETTPDGMSFDGKNVIARLTQEETKQFGAEEPAHAQLRVLTSGGDSYTSQIFDIAVEQVLNEEILG